MIFIRDNDVQILVIVINEIMYNNLGIDFLEYLEFFNNDNVVQDLVGFIFGVGVEFIFLVVILQFGDYLIIVIDLVVFE